MSQRPTLPPLEHVFAPRVGDRLPLHIRGRVASASAQRPDVVHDVARAGAARRAVGWAWVRRLEVRHDGAAAMRGRLRQRERERERQAEGQAQRCAENLHTNFSTFSPLLPGNTSANFRSASSVVTTFDGLGLSAD